MSSTTEKFKEAVKTVTTKVGITEPEASTMTLLTGAPVAENQHSLTAGPNGPVLFHDHVLFEKMNQFAREQTPPRNVHALGTGAWGKFIAENDVSKWTRAALFKQGTETEVAVRFSGTFTERGEADTIRDLRGFAMKFYTTEGNWDLMTINTPVFSVRDMKLGPDAVHGFKRNPIDGNWNPESTWDYVANHPEALHQTLMIWTDRIGTPASFRAMNSFGCNTFSFINAENKRTWVKFHVEAELGWKGITVEDAKILAGEEPDFLSKDLYQAIAEGNYPKYKIYFQAMEEAEGYTHNYTFDCTKIWPHDQFPLIPLGTLVLEKNPNDYFTEVECIAFSPANVVPGIDFSPDKLLQGRLLIYDDTQTHRLGPNHKMLPVNCPHAAKTSSYYNAGGSGINQYGQVKYPHYWPSAFGGPQPDPSYKVPPMKCDGPADFYDYPGEGTDEDYYAQVTKFYQILEPQEAKNLAHNLSITFSKCSPDVVKAVMPHLQKVHPGLVKDIDIENSARLPSKEEVRCKELLHQVHSYAPPQVM
jgi:catalase